MSFSLSEIDALLSDSEVDAILESDAAIVRVKPRAYKVALPADSGVRHALGRKEPAPGSAAGKRVKERHLLRHQLARTVGKPVRNSRDGFNIGWHYACYGLVPPEHPEYQEMRDVHTGYHAGLAHFGTRGTSGADRFVRKHLQLNLNAWLRGRIFDERITPDYLRNITPRYCPITREEMTVSTGDLSDWSVDRLINDASYAPGNLVIMSTRANQAKGSKSYAQILEIIGQGVSSSDLKTQEWARMAALVGMVSDKESLLPLLVAPPPGIPLKNEYTLLQAGTSLLILATDNGRRERTIFPALRLACHGKRARKAMDSYMDLIAARIWNIRAANPQHTRGWIIGDAWADPTVMAAFRKWMGEMSKADRQAVRKTLCRQLPGLKNFDEEFDIEAWGLASNGYVVEESRSQLKEEGYRCAQN